MKSLISRGLLKYLSKKHQPLAQKCVQTQDSSTIAHVNLENRYLTICSEPHNKTELIKAAVLMDRQTTRDNWSLHKWQLSIAWLTEIYPRHIRHPETAGWWVLETCQFFWQKWESQIKRLGGVGGADTEYEKGEAQFHKTTVTKHLHFCDLCSCILEDCKEKIRVFDQVTSFLE